MFAALGLATKTPDSEGGVETAGCDLFKEEAGISEKQGGWGGGGWGKHEAKK